ncbi:MAG: hypothetical protein AB9873_13245 [Syntrophobacteraceae bacterium]
MPPADIRNGGGNICSLSNIAGTWDFMPIVGNYQYKYRNVNGEIITGGDEHKDMVVCLIASDNCKIQ